MKKISVIKAVILVLIYGLTLPISVLFFHLLPYILKNDTNIEIQSFVLRLIQEPLKALQSVSMGEFSLLFFASQLLILLLIAVYLNPKKKKEYEVVGKTNPVHGSAYWGEESELRTPTDVHLVHFKKMKKEIKKSMGGGVINGIIAKLQRKYDL